MSLKLPTSQPLGADPKVNTYNAPNVAIMLIDSQAHI